jgi:hypothetical protein
MALAGLGVASCAVYEEPTPVQPIPAYGYGGPAYGYPYYPQMAYGYGPPVVGSVGIGLSFGDGCCHHHHGAWHHHWR